MSGDGGGDMEAWFAFLSELRARDPVAAFALAAWAHANLESQGRGQEALPRLAPLAEGLDAEQLDLGRTYAQLRMRFVKAAAAAATDRFRGEVAAKSDGATIRLQSAHRTRSMIWIVGGIVMAFGVVVALGGGLADAPAGVGIGLGVFAITARILRAALRMNRSSIDNATMELGDAASLERHASDLGRELRDLAASDAGSAMRELITDHPDLRFPELDRALIV